MILQTLRLQSFRAHEQSTVDFAPGVNLLYGPNGAGKTNLLEAVHYLCLTKSFLASNDKYALRRGAPFFEVEGTFTGERRADLRVRIAYLPEEGKRVFVNGAPVARLADHVGTIPVVAFSPDDQALTAGGPEERRRFLNNILSQSRPVYLDDLLKYRRALRQRNELLAQGRRGPNGVRADVLASWNAELVALGSRVTEARLRFITDFSAHMRRAYQYIEAVAEQPTVTYSAFARLSHEDDAVVIAQKYERKLEQMEPKERERGVTLVGPHRDELVFKLNGLDVRRYASQGQHRTFGMALKLGTCFFLQEQLDEMPILLLDDIFDHLDPARSKAFLELLQSDAVGQSLITDTRRPPFAEHVPFQEAEHRAQRVAAGRVGGEETPEL